jgi:hypothetical protein
LVSQTLGNCNIVRSDELARAVAKLIKGDSEKKTGGGFKKNSTLTKTKSLRLYQFDNHPCSPDRTGLSA